jgi:hypothetical protein
LRAGVVGGKPAAMVTSLALALALAAGTAPPTPLDVAPLPGRPNLLALAVPKIPANRDVMAAAIALFLERQLLGGGVAGGAP